MFIHYRTQGIVLKKVDRKEADQLFSIYTKDFGRLEILGKAIRKISSKLRAGIDLFYLSEIEFIQGKAHKTLTDAILIEKFKNLSRDLEKSTIALEISEVLDALIHGQEPDERIWNLLVETFRDLDKLDTKKRNPKIIYHYFFWNFLSLLGYAPELYKCVLCQGELEPQKLYFSPQHGGVVCEKCFLKENSAKEVSSDVIKILRVVLKKEKNYIYRLKLKEKHFQELDKLSKYYFEFISEQVGEI